jgi:hypothetical protein
MGRRGREPSSNGAAPHLQPSDPFQIALRPFAEVYGGAYDVLRQSPLLAHALGNS